MKSDADDDRDCTPPRARPVSRLPVVQVPTLPSLDDVRPPDWALEDAESIPLEREKAFRMWHWPGQESACGLFGKLLGSKGDEAEAVWMHMEQQAEAYFHGFVERFIRSECRHVMTTEEQQVAAVWMRELMRSPFRLLRSVADHLHDASLYECWAW